MMFSPKKKEEGNRYTRKKTIPRAPVYTMHAKAANQRSESMHKVGAIVLAIAALGDPLQAFSAAQPPAWRKAATQPGPRHRPTGCLANR